MGRSAGSIGQGNLDRLGLGINLYLTETYNFIFTGGFVINISLDLDDLFTNFSLGSNDFLGDDGISTFSEFDILDNKLGFVGVVFRNNNLLGDGCGVEFHLDSGVCKSRCLKSSFFYLGTIVLLTAGDKCHSAECGSYEQNFGNGFHDCINN